jgi:uncharacterized Zn finger protein
MSKRKRHALRTPLSVKGGIRAQNAHSGHLRVWWSRRWTEMLENFRLGARLGRGRSYAVSGQVSTLSIEAGCVSASVQGTSSEPYESVLHFQCVDGEAKARIVAALRARPVWVARLLVGDLPFEVEPLFLAEGCPLFPKRNHDLVSRCTCPDWANPCKHLAAVYFLLGETITKNPLLLLNLRGVSRADVVGEIAPALKPAGLPAAAHAEEPLTAERFYGVTHAPLDDFGVAPKVSTHAPLIHRLGPLPFWRGQERFTDTLEHLYARAATRGWTVWTGEPLDLRREEEKVIIKGANLHLKQHRMRVDATR